jgi:hypothetical protein
MDNMNVGNQIVSLLHPCDRTFKSFFQIYNFVPNSFSIRTCMWELWAYKIIKFIIT